MMNKIQIMLLNHVSNLSSSYFGITDPKSKIQHYHASQTFRQNECCMTLMKINSAPPSYLVLFQFFQFLFTFKSLSYQKQLLLQASKPRRYCVKAQQDLWLRMYMVVVSSVDLLSTALVQLQLILFLTYLIIILVNLRLKITNNTYDLNVQPKRH